jgi:methylase of polypeptide subunit release factors
MSQRDSGYARKANEAYQTPEWVVEAVLPHIPQHGIVPMIWEPACGNGNIVKVLSDNGYSVHATDAQDGANFYAFDTDQGCDGIITNPPYTDAAAFVEHALNLMQPMSGFVLMLLAQDFDSAKSRRYLFEDAPFAKKITLLKRIVWFKRTDGKREAPSQNHAWYLWDWNHQGAPTLAWA